MQCDNAAMFLWTNLVLQRRQVLFIMVCFFYCRPPFYVGADYIFTIPFLLLTGDDAAVQHPDIRKAVDDMDPICRKGRRTGVLVLDISN